MRFSAIGGKEIVNLCDGSRLGVIAESDLLIDEKTGKIVALLIPDDKNFLNFFSNNSVLEIPWEAVKKIGNDMIIIELEDDKKRKYSL
ncbi:YlmC/YmxH family sporulation protein [Clostridium formicaceticum]|uniref:PRC-barrel domain protein n=1 Tax=Clostridium formicaceticum TaxID=1497 RepID=A0AAC9RM13_9CLOT|nr:YlmC/YmxH family sporulation protein [Clostridium formicaceticum]AOY77266.1 YlmC/YmxH family sporulation protein [Clostridium formicaceticum]ARE87805.1 PRC-barrel domain protein [Clostridium formicaceticum]